MQSRTGSRAAASAHARRPPRRRRRQCLRPLASAARLQLQHQRRPRQPRARRTRRTHGANRLQPLTRHRSQPSRRARELGPPASPLPSAQPPRKPRPCRRPPTPRRPSRPSARAKRRKTLASQHQLRRWPSRYRGPSPRPSPRRRLPPRAALRPHAALLPRRAANAERGPRDRATGAVAGVRCLRDAAVRPQSRRARNGDELAHAGFAALPMTPADWMARLCRTSFAAPVSGENQPTDPPPLQAGHARSDTCMLS